MTHVTCNEFRICPSLDTKENMDKILVMAKITLTTKKINRNLLTEAVLNYVIEWAYFSLMYYFEINNFRNRVIHWHCLNRLSKLTAKKSKKKITELSGIVIILVDHFNKFSFSFMFHLDESAGRKYFKFRLWSICVSSQYVLIQ